MPGLKSVLLLLVVQNFATAIHHISSFSLQDELKQSVLNHLKFEKIPEFSKEEFDHFQIPAFMKMRYDLLAWKNKANFDLEKLERNRRSSIPSLAGLFNEVHKNSSKIFKLF